MIGGHQIGVRHFKNAIIGRKSRKNITVVLLVRVVLCVFYFNCVYVMLFYCVVLFITICCFFNGLSIRLLLVTTEVHFWVQYIKLMWNVYSFQYFKSYISVWNKYFSNSGNSDKRLRQDSFISSLFVKDIMNFSLKFGLILHSNNYISK